jgi:hypothetical protein
MADKSPVGAALLLAMIVGCGASSGERERQVAAIAASYTSWGRVDDELRWAPALCRTPHPATARVSKSSDEATHGRKLYSVFAKHHARYPAGPHEGQVVVKESWIAERLSEPAPPDDWRLYRGRDAADHFHPYAKDEAGVEYRAAARADLFVMFKVDPAPDTDDGWIYATVTTQGRISALGRLDSCITCHEDAPHHRLFGVPTAEELPAQ